jgi:N-acetylmuramoyl-L-alanine amidase
MIVWVSITAIGLALLAASGSSRPASSVAWKIVDRRKQARLTADAKKHTSTRKASDVFALVLHQMGFDRGNDPRKYDKVTAHYIVLQDGGTYQLHDHTIRLPASSGLNAGSVSVEFAGNLPSRARSTNPKAFWSPDTKGMDQLTPQQSEAGRALLHHLVHNHGFTHVYAHRQGGQKRENCPGPDVWREVGAWGVQQFGLSWGGEGWAVDAGKIHGLPIPAAWWDPPPSEPSDNPEIAEIA